MKEEGGGKGRGNMPARSHCLFGEPVHARIGALIGVVGLILSMPANHFVVPENGHAPPPPPLPCGRVFVLHSIYLNATKSRKTV